VWRILAIFFGKNRQKIGKSKIFQKKMRFFAQKFCSMKCFLYVCHVRNIIFKNSYNIIYHMNKTELINAVAEKAGLTKVDAKNALDAVVAAVSDALAKGDKVSLVGFGTLSVVEKGERTGINPRTKESITIAARKVVKFKQGAELSEAIK
jgi:DNA-binding protein HU-beta